MWPVRGYSRAGQRFSSPKMRLTQGVAPGLGFTRLPSCPGGLKQPGCPWYLPFRQQGRVGLGRVLSQLLVWLSLSCCRLWMPQILWCGTAGTPALSWESGPAGSQAVCSQFCCFPIQCTKIHLRGALFCPCLYSACSDRFFEGTSVLRDADGHPGSSEQLSRHHPPFSGT